MSISQIASVVGVVLVLLWRTDVVGRQQTETVLVGIWTPLFGGTSHSACSRTVGAISSGIGRRYRFPALRRRWALRRRCEPRISADCCFRDQCSATGETRLGPNDRPTPRREASACS
jgi:hypothetical protein